METRRVSTAPFMAAMTIMMGGQSPSSFDLPQICIMAKYLMDMKSNKVDQGSYDRWRFDYLREFCNGWATYLTNEDLITEKQVLHLFDKKVNAHEHFPKEQEVLRKLSLSAYTNLAECLKIDLEGQLRKYGNLLGDSGQEPAPPNVARITSLLEMADQRGVEYDPDKITFCWSKEGGFEPTDECNEQVTSIKEGLFREVQSLQEMTKKLNELAASLQQFTAQAGIAPQRSPQGTPLARGPPSKKGDTPW